jgi:hypothetical protein
MDMITQLFGFVAQPTGLISLMLTFRGCPLFFAKVPQELLPELNLAFFLL